MKDGKVFSTRRIEALSDGVFAIAMTLLVLDLVIPLQENIHTNAQFVSALNDLLPTFRNFVISFLLLGTVWGVHQRQFEFITKTDRRLSFLNNLRLLTVVLIPFTTSVANDYENVDLAVAMLPFNFFLIALVSTWQWHYAASKKELCPELSDELKRKGEIRNIVLVTLSGLITLASFVIGVWALLLFMLTPFAMSRVEKWLLRSGS